MPIRRVELKRTKKPFIPGGLPEQRRAKPQPLDFQPVIPISLNKDWKLITPTIVPIIDQTDVVAPNTSQGSLSDITQSFFFSPKRPVAGMIVGAGPVFVYPSATDDLLGSEKWGDSFPCE